VVWKRDGLVAVVLLLCCRGMWVRSMTSGRLPWTFADMAGEGWGFGDAWEVPDLARLNSGGAATAAVAETGDEGRRDASSGLAAESCGRLGG
jgi:hypothetical protein